MERDEYGQIPPDGLNFARRSAMLVDMTKQNKKRKMTRWEKWKRRTGRRVRAAVVPLLAIPAVQLGLGGGTLVLALLLLLTGYGPIAWALILIATAILLLWWEQQQQHRPG